MSHFNVKTLSFYGIAISSVLLLFKVVSAYGETKLNAAVDIDGSYQFSQVANLPDCLQGKQLNLNIEQSGVYLFGNLEVASPGETSGGDVNSAIQPQSKSERAVKIPFNGDFNNNQVVMSGKGNVANCDSELQLTIQGERENNNLVGQIQDNLAKTEGAFVARYQKPASESAESAEGH
jgi:hypothetical protein